MDQVNTSSKPRFFYGYTITVLCAVMYCVGSGIMLYGVGPLVDEMINFFKWSPSTIGTALGAKGLIGLASPIVGMVTIKYGQRKVLGIAGILVGVLLFVTAFIQTSWQFIVTYVVGLSVAFLFINMIGIFSLLANWWKARLGTMSGIVNGMGGIGQTIFVPVVAILLATYGWKTSMIILAVIFLAVVALPAIFVTRNFPKEKGQIVDGGVIGQSGAKEKPVRYYFSSVDWGVKDAIKTYQLWFILIVWAALTWTFISVIYFAFTYLMDKGFSLEIVTAVQSAQGVATIVGSVVGGILVDRFGPRPIYLIAILFNVVGVGVLLIANSVPLLWVYTLVLGLGVGINNPCVVALITSYYGRKNYAAIQGSAMPVMAVSSGLAPIVSGLLADATGGFSTGFFVSIGLCAISFLFIIIAKPPKAPAHLQAETDNNAG